MPTDATLPADAWIDISSCVAYRISTQDPKLLMPPSKWAPPPPDSFGPGRFDDPQGIYAVRYAATWLEGALAEVMWAFRPPNSTAVAQFDNVDMFGESDERISTDKADLHHSRSLAGWLAEKRLATFQATDPGARLLDINHPAVHRSLERNSQIGQEIRSFANAIFTSDGNGNPVVGSVPVNRLDQALVQLATGDGRRLTRAISRAVRQLWPNSLGIAYRSRVAHVPDHEWTESRRCWALWDATSVDWLGEPVPLSHETEEHLRLVQKIAQQLELDLTGPWNRRIR